MPICYVKPKFYIYSRNISNISSKLDLIRWMGRLVWSIWRHVWHRFNYPQQNYLINYPIYIHLPCGKDWKNALHANEIINIYTFVHIMLSAVITKAAISYSPPPPKVCESPIRGDPYSGTFAHFWGGRPFPLRKCTKVPVPVLMKLYTTPASILTLLTWVP